MGRHSRRGLFLLGLLLWLGRAVPSAAVEGTCASPTFIPSTGGVFTGTTSGASALTQNCGTTASAPESVFTWTPAVNGTAVLTTIHSGFDTVLAVEGQCGVGTTTLAGGCGNDGASCCGDCNGGAGLWDSTVTVTVTAGVPLFVIVDGDGSCSASTCTDRNQGPYRLVVTPPGVSTTTVPACASTTTTTSTSTTSTSSTSTSTTTTPGATTTSTTLHIPPSYPGNLQVHTTQCGPNPHVTLTWNASTAGSSAIDGYIVERWDGGFDWSDRCTGNGTPFACCTGVGTGTCIGEFRPDQCTNHCPGGAGHGSCCAGHFQGGILQMTSDFPCGNPAGPNCSFTEILDRPDIYYYAVVAYDQASPAATSLNPDTCPLPYTGGGGVCGPFLTSGCTPYPCFQCTYSGTTSYTGGYCTPGDSHDCGNPAGSECAVCVVPTTSTTSTTTTTTSTTAGAATTTTCPTFSGGGGTPQWADKIGGPGVEQVRAVASAPGGDVIAVGYFAGTTNFGGTSLTSVQNPNLFIARYHPDGTLVWVKQYGGIASVFSNSEANAVAVDANGAILIGGDYFGTADFGAGGQHTSVKGCVGGANDHKLCATTADCGGSACGVTQDMFVAKYDAAGNPVWSRSMGGPVSDILQGVAVAANGDVVVTGKFQNSVDMGGGVIAIPLGGIATALAKYTSARGDVSWIHPLFAATADNSGQGVVVDASDHVFLMTAFQGKINFGGGDMQDTTGFGKIGLGKFTSGGTYVAQALYGTPNGLNASGTGGVCTYGCTPMALDHNGDVVVIGAYNGAITIPTMPTATALTSRGFQDILLVKAHGTDLTPMWAKSFGGAQSDDIGRAVAVDANNNITMTGTFVGSAIFDGVTLSVAGGSQEEIFLAKYNLSGTQSWAKAFGGNVQDFGLGVTYTACNAPVVGGVFTSPSIPFGSFTLTNGGGVANNEGYLVEVAP